MVMQWIKLIMLGLVFLGSMLVGKMAAQKYRYRLLQLEEMKNALTILKTKIKYTYEPIPEIFQEISHHMPQNMARIFQKTNELLVTESIGVAWEKAIDDTDLNLNQDDKQALKTLSKLLRND